MDRSSVPADLANIPVGPAYDPAFLPVSVPLPHAVSERDLVQLDYSHFTVLLDKNRRLAAATAVNINGGALLDIEREDDWHLDPRVSAREQAGPELYNNNDLDRGHLVRRRDPVWGTPAVARRANTDSFVYTNAAPQAARFNQSKELWSGLEDYLLEHARAFDLRLTVFTGPVFTPADPQYRGIQIPLAYWKVAAWVDENGSLAATGYVVEQSRQLDNVALEEAFRRAVSDQTVPPLGDFRTFQVPILDIEALTQLGFGPATLADRLVQRELVPDVHSRWVRIERFGDVILQSAGR